MTEGKCPAIPARELDQCWASTPTQPNHAVAATLRMNQWTRAYKISLSAYLFSFLNEYMWILWKEWKEFANFYHCPFFWRNLSFLSQVEFLQDLLSPWSRPCMSTFLNIHADKDPFFSFCDYIMLILNSVISNIHSINNSTGAWALSFACITFEIWSCLNIIFTVALKGNTHGNMGSGLSPVLSFRASLNYAEALRAEERGQKYLEFPWRFQALFL